MTETKKPRRDFLFVATGAVSAIGVAAVSLPLLGHMAPAPDAPNLSGLKVDLSLLREGEEMRVNYMGKPVAIRHRTPSEISAARAGDEAELFDKETDRSRLRPKPNGTYDPRFLVFYPICTHFNYVVVSEAGDFDGWYCPYHSAHFDTSGRIRKGPAPFNLKIPNYKWVSETVIELLRLPLLGIPAAKAL